MQSATIILKLDKLGQDVRREGVTPAEAAYYVAEHFKRAGGNPVTIVGEPEEITRTPVQELKRLFTLFPTKKIKTLYPSVMASIPASFDEAVEVGQATAMPEGQLMEFKIAERMLGNTLARVTTMLKAELGASLTVGTADDQRYYQLIESQQEWFSSMYDWNILKDKWEVSVLAGTAGRYSTIPTTDTNSVVAEINFDRPLCVYVFYASKWQPLEYGIGVDEMNTWDSDHTTVAIDPILKWQHKTGNRLLMETWPLTATDQTVRFAGQRKLTTLRSAGNFSTSTTLDLDDRLVALSIAVDLLTSKEDPSAKAKSERLQALWGTVRAAETKSVMGFTFGQPIGMPPKVQPKNYTTG